MAETWRLLDTGLGSAARNIALSRALLDARAADEIASTLRFTRYARCPKCNAVTKNSAETTLVAATYDMGGRVRVDEKCEFCGYENSFERSTPKRTRSSSSSSSGFSGGSSSGRGSSGRW